MSSLERRAVDLADQVAHRERAVGGRARADQGDLEGRASPSRPAPAGRRRPRCPARTPSAPGPRRGPRRRSCRRGRPPPWGRRRRSRFEPGAHHLEQVEVAVLGRHRDRGHPELAVVAVGLLAVGTWMISLPSGCAEDVDRRTRGVGRVRQRLEQRDHRQRGHQRHRQRRRRTHAGSWRKLSQTAGSRARARVSRARRCSSAGARAVGARDAVRGVRRSATPVERSRRRGSRAGRGGCSRSRAAPSRRTASSRSTSPRPSRPTQPTQAIATSVTTTGGTSQSRISTLRG